LEKWGTHHHLSTTLKSSLSNLIEFTVQFRTESRSIDRFDDSTARDFAFAIAS